MAGIKTGIGGFDIDGKVHDFDVGDPSAPGTPREKLPSADTGDIKIDDRKKDISKGTRRTLADYLKNTTKGNRFPIEGEQRDVKITDEKGFPEHLEERANPKQFTDRTHAAGMATGPYDPASTLQGLNKGKKPSPGIDGHSLLPSIQKDSLPELLNKYTSSALNNNRFTESKKMAPDLSGVTNDSKPIPHYNPTLHHPRYGDVSMNRLAQVGTALSIRSSQELGATSPGNNPTGGTQQAADLLPGANQLGATKVKTRLLEARDILESLTSKEIPTEDFFDIGSNDSWGALNNVDDPWSGITSLGMIALSTALTAAITLLFEAFGLLFGLIKASTGSARNVSGRYVLGRSTVTKSADPNAFPPSLPPDIGALLGLKGTVFPFKTCVQKGTKVFFGIDDSNGVLGVLTSGLKSAAQNPGYNSIVARTIIRSSITIVDSFKKAFNSSNVVSGIKNVLNIIDVIRSSKIIAAANVFAVLGDQTLTDPGFTASDAIKEEPIKKSRIDSLSNDVPHVAVQKNRLRDSVKLAWASNRSPALYLIPESIQTMGALDNSLGAFKGAAALSDADSKTRKLLLTKADATLNGSRIPRKSTYALDQDSVESFEAALDAEYVPFSFHDLRTNEIISFHAFLTSLNDDYAANYESTDGFGRVEPVKIYKGTQRKIGMSFYVVATSPQDFDDMWVKLNKLTTMWYPQYTMGRMVEGENVKFVQPFSQLIGASPVIRIRLGDLFRSNYSRFALARLFGFGGAETLKIDGNDIDPFSGVDDAAISKAQVKLAQPSPNMEYTVSSDKFPQAEGGLGISISPPIPLGGGSDEPKQSPSFWLDLNDASYIIAVVVKYDEHTKTASVKPKIMSTDEMTKEFGLDSRSAGKIYSALKEKYDNSKDPSRRIVGAVYSVPMAYLKPTSTTIQKAFAENLQTNDNIDKVAEFLTSDKNAIVRSFESVRGKGLAGVIESANFDWYDKVTWETLPGSTAPKMCKITISFSPIHDISPGIDHLGYNRSPIYPVGAAMKHGRDSEKK